MLIGVDILTCSMLTFWRGGIGKDSSWRLLSDHGRSTRTCCRSAYTSSHLRHSKLSTRTRWTTGFL